MNNRQEEPTNENTDPNQNNCFSITSFKLPPYNSLQNNYNNKFKNYDNNNNKNNNNCINKMEIINDILAIDNSDEELNNNNNSNNNNNNNNNNKNAIYNNFKLNKSNEKRLKRCENSLLNQTISSLEECTISPLTEEQRYTFQQGLRNLPQTPTIFEVVTPPTTPPGSEIAFQNKKTKVNHMASISTMKRKLNFNSYFKPADIA
ncbi:hypothetical protein ACTFIT_000372 [Dictyostelium discoideum]